MTSPKKKENDPATRKNFDKRTIRKMYAQPFEQAITELHRHSQSSVDEAVLRYTAQDVQVYCRKRPINAFELNHRVFDVLKVGPDGAPTVHDCRIHRDMRHLQLNNHCFPVPCFDENTSTEQVCEHVQIDQFYELAARGGHGTLCMFGQTGSGKTYTMGGILRHTAATMFRAREGSQNGAAVTGVEVRVACFEVCGKNVFDLLKNGDKLDVREDSYGSVQVSATSVEVKSGQALLEVVTFAGSQRMSCTTLKNEASSRSHAFYRLIMKDPGGGRAGSLTFVDLAGSERAADSLYHDPQQVQQSAEINASLSALKDCVRVRSQQLRSSTKKRVPYRSSRLTMLLRDSFDTEGDGCAGRAGSGVPPSRRATAPAPAAGRSATTSAAARAASSTAAKGRAPLSGSKSFSARGTASSPAGRSTTRTALSGRPPVPAPPPPGGGDGRSGAGMGGGAGARARTVVIVTAAPGCDDTEHTLNTLRTACMMAGLEGRTSRSTNHQVSLDDNVEHREKFTATVKHPTRWTEEEVKQWFQTACNGAFTRTGGKLPAGLDGKALSRLPELRFRLFCDKDARSGSRLYKVQAFKDETQRANVSKANAAEAVRTAQETLKL